MICNEYVLSNNSKYVSNALVSIMNDSELCIYWLLIDFYISVFGIIYDLVYLFVFI